MPFKSNCSWMLYRIGVYKNSAKFSGKHLHWSLSHIKKRLRHRCFPVNFTKFFRTPFLQNTSERLLLTFRCNNSFKRIFQIFRSQDAYYFLTISQTNVYNWVYVSHWVCSVLYVLEISNWASEEPLLI